MNRYLAIFLLLSSFSAYAALHKWIDADGVVHYSDTVPSEELKAKKLRSSATSPTSEAASGSAVTAPKSTAERNADLKKAQKAKNEAAEKIAREQEDADNKKKSCENARTNLTTLENAPRLVTYNAQGEQTVMDDNARQQGIEEARKAISAYCN